MKKEFNGKDYLPVIFDNTSFDEIVDMAESQNIAFKHIDQNMVFLMDKGSNSINIVDIDKTEQGKTIDLLADCNTEKDVFNLFCSYYSVICMDHVYSSFESILNNPNFSSLIGDKAFAIEDVLSSDMREKCLTKV